MKQILNEWKKFLNESGFNRIMAILQGNVPAVDSVAFLTAANPYGAPTSAKLNRARNLQLAAWLRARGLGYIRIRGRFGGPEKSFIVNNITKSETIAAGLEFEQEAVIWGEKTFNEDGLPTGFRFYYIEQDVVKQVRDIVLSGEEIQDREDFYSQERQTAARKFVVPFFDEDYEVVSTDEGKHNFILVPPLTPDQEEQHRDLIAEVNDRTRKSLEEERTPKSRWHHRHLLRLKLKELKKRL
tara:strand:+ start:745 stop:1467 length:723 start_codon:yes stop_codon:yes gene_type:complete